MTSLGATRAGPKSNLGLRNRGEAVRRQIQPEFVESYRDIPHKEIGKLDGFPFSSHHREETVPIFHILTQHAFQHEADQSVGD